MQIQIYTTYIEINWIVSHIYIEPIMYTCAYMDHNNTYIMCMQTHTRTYMLYHHGESQCVLQFVVRPYVFSVMVSYTLLL